MLSLRLQKYIDRLRNLIQEGEAISESCVFSSGVMVALDSARYVEWTLNARHIVNLSLGETSIHAKEMARASSGYPQSKATIEIRLGVLRAALSDLEEGLLHNLEAAITGEVLRSVLSQARHLNDGGFKDAAAILANTVLENALHRLANEEGMDDTKPLYRINQDLWRIANRYDEQQWTQVSTYLAIGLSVANGRFSDFTQSDVAQMLEGVSAFLAIFLK